MLNEFSKRCNSNLIVDNHKKKKNDFGKAEQNWKF